jgi:integrase
VASIFAKNGKWWAKLKGLRKPGKWDSKPTTFAATEANRDIALSVAIEMQALLDAQVSVETELTVEGYATRWLASREGKRESHADDVGRINNHVLPVLGPMRMADVRPRHVRDLVRKLNENPALAPRTVRNIYSVLRSMMAEAVADEVIPVNPCAIKPGELPTKVDKDPEWRELATFTMDEVTALCSDPRIPAERRVQYACKALAGLRHGEVAGLLWRHLLPDAPLAKLTIARSYLKTRTKTEVTRPVPVHAELARVLRHWRALWSTVHGRPPGADDLVTPTRAGTVVDANDAVRYFKDDLATLGLRIEAGEHRDRGGHDLRAWFITTCLEHGASAEALMRVTHTKRRDVQSGYTRLPWPAICAAVAKMPIVLPENPLELGSELVARSANAVKRWRKSATPTGFEPDILTAKGCKTWLSVEDADGVEHFHDVSNSFQPQGRVSGDLENLDEGED